MSAMAMQINARTHSEPFMATKSFHIPPPQTFYMLMKSFHIPPGPSMATVTNPGSFMATITHPTGNGYCRDGTLCDRTGSGYISTCHIKDPLIVFTHPLHIIIAMSYNAPLDCFWTPPHILSLQCHIMPPPPPPPPLHIWIP